MNNEIKVTASAIDGSETVRTYKRLSMAQKFAWGKVGETPEIGIAGQAVSGDGIVTISVEGCTIWELFPSAEQWQERSMAEQLTQEFHEGQRVLVDDGASNPYTANFIRYSDEGKATVDAGDAENTDFIEVAIAWISPMFPDNADEESDDDITGSKMSIALRKARARYVKVKRKEGTSAHCNDPIARALEDCEPLEVAALADKVFGEAAGFHAAKYAHLNQGQIRMNSGNRIRAAFKKGDEAEQTRIIDILMGNND